MASSSSTPLPGGNTTAPLLTIRTISPLPIFSTFHSVPPSNASISSFKLSLLLILTGAHTSSSSSKPLTSSEQLKEMTMQQWRLDLLQLELRQNQIIAPETRNKQVDGEGEEMIGFELMDDHECALLEEGDEVVIRLKAGHSISEMKLPQLPSNHKYAAPAGSLTRAGTLSAPPPYSISAPLEPSSHSSSIAAQPNANFHAHKYRDYSGGWRVVKAQNGVTGVSNPNGVLKTKKAAPKEIGLNVASGSGTGGLNSNGGGGGGRAAAAAAAEKRINSSSNNNSPTAMPAHTRRMSASNANNPTVQRPSNSNTRQISSGSGNNSRSRPQSAGANFMMNSTSSPDPNASNSNPVTPQFNQQSQFSSSTSPSPQQGSSVQASSSALPTYSYNPTSPSGQASMPLTALVIGPGVQGQVGRNSNSPAAPMGTAGQGRVMGGNANAFVGFTAASGEVQPRSKPRRKMSRNQSVDGGTMLNEGEGGMGKEAALNAFPPIFNGNGNSSAAADAAERRAALEKQQRLENESNENNNENGNRNRKTSNSKPDRLKSRTNSSSSTSRVGLPALTSLPPIQNLAPFPDEQNFDRERRERFGLSAKENGLPEMPTAVGAPTVGEDGMEEASTTHEREDSRDSLGSGRREREKIGDRKVSGTSSREGNERIELNRKVSSLSRESNLNSSQTNFNGNTDSNGSARPQPVSRISSGLNFFRKSSGKLDGGGSSGAATPNSTGFEEKGEEGYGFNELSQDNSSSNFNVNVIASSSKGKGKEDPKPSKAQLRYLEVQRSLQKEREKQTQAEELRKEEFKAKELRKEKERERKEIEEKKKKVEEQWKIWEEIRRREKELGLPPPNDGGDRTKGRDGS